MNMKNEEYIKEREELVNEIQDMLINYCDKYGNEEFLRLMLGFFLATLDSCCDLDDDSKVTFYNEFRDITINPKKHNQHLN